MGDREYRGAYYVPGDMHELRPEIEYGRIAVQLRTPRNRKPDAYITYWYYSDGTISKQFHQYRNSKDHSLDTWFVSNSREEMFGWDGCDSLERPAEWRSITAAEYDEFFADAAAGLVPQKDAYVLDDLYMYLSKKHGRPPSSGFQDKQVAFLDNFADKKPTLPDGLVVTPPKVPVPVSIDNLMTARAIILPHEFLPLETVAGLIERDDWQELTAFWETK